MTAEIAVDAFNYTDLRKALSSGGALGCLRCNEVATAGDGCAFIACYPLQSFASGESVMTFCEAIAVDAKPEGFFELQSDFVLHHVGSNGE